VVFSQGSALYTNIWFGIIVHRVVFPPQKFSEKDELLFDISCGGFHYNVL